MVMLPLSLIFFQRARELLCGGSVGVSQRGEQRQSRDTDGVHAFS